MLKGQTRKCWYNVLIVRHIAVELLSFDEIEYHLLKQRVAITAREKLRPASDCFLENTTSGEIG